MVVAVEAGSDVTRGFSLEGTASIGIRERHVEHYIRMQTASNRTRYGGVLEFLTIVGRYSGRKVNLDHDANDPARRIGAHVLLRVHLRTIEVRVVSLSNDAHRGDHARRETCDDEIRWRETLAASLVVRRCVRDQFDSARSVDCLAPEFAEIEH